MQYLLTGLLLFGISLQVQAQVELYGLHARWDDSFAEWTISTYNDPKAGQLVRQWPLGNDWTQWSIRLGDFSGTIRQKFAHNPAQWELRFGNEVVTMRPVYPGDANIWRIQSGDLNLTWSRDSRHLDAQWTIDRVPGFSMYTEFKGDPRDWIINDEVVPSLTTAAKLAMIFLTVFYSTPKL